MGNGTGANASGDGEFSRRVGGEIEDGAAGIVGDFLGFDKIERGRDFEIDR